MHKLDATTRKDLYTRDVILQHLAHTGKLRAPNLTHRCSRDRCSPRNYLELKIPNAEHMQLEESIFVCRECKVHKCNDLCEGVLAGPGRSDYFCHISGKMKGHERMEIEVEGRDQVSSFTDKATGRENVMSHVLELTNDARLKGEKLDEYYSRYELPRLKTRQSMSSQTSHTTIGKSKVENVIVTKSRKDMEDTLTKHASKLSGILEIFYGSRPIKTTQMEIPVFLHLPDCRDYIVNHLFRVRRDGRRVPSTTLLVSADKLLLSDCLQQYAERIEKLKRANGMISKQNDTASKWREDLSNFEKKSAQTVKKIEDIFRFYFPSISRWRSSLVTLQSQQCQKYADVINNLRNCKAEGVWPNLFVISHDLDLSTVWRSETLIDFPTHTMYTRYFRIVYTMLQYCLSTYEIISKMKRLSNSTSETMFKSVTIDKLVFGILEILQTGMRTADGITVIPKDFYLNRKGITPEKNKLVMFSKNSRKTESRGIAIVTKCLEYGLRTMTPAQLWLLVSGQKVFS